MPRIGHLAESGLLTGSKLLKTGKGFVFSITIAFEGATAGDKVLLRDGVTGAATPEVVFVLPAANGTITKEWVHGKEFDVGIFYDEGPNPFTSTEITFK